MKPAFRLLNRQCASNQRHFLFNFQVVSVLLQSEMEFRVRWKMNNIKKLSSSFPYIYFLSKFIYFTTMKMQSAMILPYNLPERKRNFSPKLKTKFR